MAKLESKKVVAAMAAAVSLIVPSNARAQNAASIDDGDRLVVPYDWKVEHRARNAIDNFVHQLGTPEGRAIRGAVGAAVGFDSAVARMVSANIPLADSEEAKPSMAAAALTAGSRNTPSFSRATCTCRICISMR
ncbi:hypothetical protein [Bradyrhizobium sp. LTSP857]|uniref:hypothetical protein n=1 Tax=Bradyrhizobium sp. LTSP857 TaxID=1619231 RepID=UPI0005D1D50E|nr:hypothetical protein [Bradyrhizobium sp. LTSP857]KJC45299.1 hypothetical protein UP06_14825 [Bradyrhizobium sp. LTSP857]